MALSDVLRDFCDPAFGLPRSQSLNCLDRRENRGLHERNEYPWPEPDQRVLA
jgi:hypothetical protein